MAKSVHHPFLRLAVTSTALSLVLPTALYGEQGVQNKPIVLKMQPSGIEREGRFTIETDAKGNAKIVPAKKKKLLKADVGVDGVNYSVYLSSEPPYSLVNMGSDDTYFENKSTPLYVDSNRDGKLGDDEEWYANMPVRIGDKMFEVKRIAKNGSEIELLPSQQPLRGLIAGRKCPPFRFLAQNGKVVSLESLKGKPFLLDVWSTT